MKDDMKLMCKCLKDAVAVARETGWGVVDLNLDGVATIAVELFRHRCDMAICEMDVPAEDKDHLVKDKIPIRYLDDLDVLHRFWKERNGQPNADSPERYVKQSCVYKEGGHVESHDHLLIAEYKPTHSHDEEV